MPPSKPTTITKNPKKRLYCNGKKIPKWAENKKEVIKTTIYQQKFIDPKNIFGNFKGVENLDNSQIYNIASMKFDERGSSANWKNENPTPNKNNNTHTPRQEGGILHSMKKILNSVQK